MWDPAFQNPPPVRLYKVVHPLLRSSREVLQAPTSSTAMKSVAGAALLAALDEDLQLPAEYLRTIWSWLRASTATYWNADKFAEAADEGIRAEALEMLRDPGSGSNERRLAVQVLSGSGHAAHLKDCTLLDLVERARSGGHALDVAGLVGVVHKARGVPDHVLTAIRDRWATGTIGM